MTKEVETKGWSSPGSDVFVPNVSTLVANLEPGMYEPGRSMQLGPFLKRVRFSEQNIIALPDRTATVVIEDIRKFWAQEAKFRRYKFPYKRGILMHGPQGGGKTSTITIICKDVMAAGGFVLKFTTYDTFIPALQLLKRIHPNSKVVVLMEDLDEILHYENISQILQLLDGAEASIDNVVWLATTNRLERLDPNVRNRPSRFDRKIEFKYPNAEVRAAYYSSLFLEEDKAAHDIQKWAAETDGFSFAHMKELFVSVVILGNSYDEALKELKSMGNLSDSSEDE